jgi:hypothetical protein
VARTLKDLADLKLTFSSTKQYSDQTAAAFLALAGTECQLAARGKSQLSGAANSALDIT